MTAATLNDTDREWLTRSAELTALVDSIAVRRDLTVTITDQPVIAPGLFRPSTCAITLDANKLLPPNTEPDDVSFADPRDLADNPIVAGVLAHEVSHADHTIWNGDLGPHRQWVTMLEEPRIESVMARTRPHTRQWMQASVAHILGKVDPTSAVEAANSLILLGGRLLGGVIDPHDGLDLDAVCAPWLTPEQIAVITGAVDTAVGLDDGDNAGMAECAATIAAALRTDGQDPDDDANSNGNGGDSGQHIPGAVGTPVQGNGGTGQQNSDQQSSAADGANGQPNAGTGSTPGNGADTPTGQRDPAAVAALNAALNDTAQDAQDAMNAAAGNITASPAAQRRHQAENQRATTISGSSSDAKSTRHRVTFRKPTAAELAGRENLCRALRRAADRGYDTTRTAHQTPPGKLNMRELVRRSGQRATGQTVTATPWTTSNRRRRRQPTLTVGVAADISPSQDHVTDPVGVATWLLNVLPRDRGGRVETVTWHSTAAKLPIGRGDLIPVADTDGSSVGLPKALQALDGMLHLHANRDGARLVVVITDAMLPNEGAINAELQRLLDDGVRVLWLLSQRARGYQMTPVRGVTVAHIDNPATLADTIATAAVDTLNAY
ncbi:hypothetical protein [Gordonia sihwensis]|uniref:hypothetical protein n=1 Tax=Gordonia sihwensis TaxID=173559 RepID=UPI0012E05E8B|nr:hypothetical protein [Gordonia sihwensis]